LLVDEVEYEMVGRWAHVVVYAFVSKPAGPRVFKILCTYTVVIKSSEQGYSISVRDGE
jgi:hypothetical protein